MHSPTATCDHTSTVSACAVRALCDSLGVDLAEVARHAGLPVHLLEQGYATPPMIGAFTKKAIALSTDRG